VLRQKFRLLFVSHCLPPTGRPNMNLGGMQRAAMELQASLEALEDLQLQSCVLQSSRFWHYVRIIPFYIRSLYRIWHLSRTGQIDGVLFSAMPTAWMAIVLRKVLTKHSVVAATICHGHDVTMTFPPYQWCVPRIFAALDAILPVSQATGQQCLRRGLPLDKLFVTPNGVDMDRFPRRVQGRHADRSLLAGVGPALPADALLLCSVGRQVPRKGFAWFVDQVMPALPEHVHYWLAGTGPEHKNIAMAIARHGLEKRVTLLGRVSEEQLSSLYRGADLFIMPNVPVPGDMEGFGLVLVEAGISGLPAVASAMEGILDVVTDGVNGHLVPSENAPAFVAAIAPYVIDTAQRIAASDRAVSYTLETFGWAAVAQSVLQTLRTASLQCRHN